MERRVYNEHERALIEAGRKGQAKAHWTGRWVAAGRPSDMLTVHGQRLTARQG